MEVQYTFPRPGRALWAILGVLTAVGIATGFMAAWGSGADRIFYWLAFVPDLGFRQPWRFLTSDQLTSPEGVSHLVFTLLGVYFLGVSLEQKWGGWRFARFLGLSVIAGNLAVFLVDRFIPPSAPARFHPDYTYGLMAAITAIAIAWTRDYADTSVRLMFVLPVKGRVLYWVTIGFCVLDLIYPSAIPEGVVAPFGGLVVGLLFGGSPSLMRTAWLRTRLMFLRRQGAALRVDDILQPKAPRRPRPGAPPLRVVPGGLDEVLKKRTPPKDKRYLN